MNLRRINDISLKWKLIIPFLFLATVGAMALFLVSYRFQSSLIEVDEKRRLRNLYQVFLNDLDFTKNMALSLAYLTAQNPDTAEALARRDRRRLTELLAPAFQTLQRDFGILQFHLHIPPATSFLRLHAPRQHGENMEAYRPTINRARETGTGVGGIEMGVLGLSIRSVAPVFHQGRLAGTVEFGVSLGMPLLTEFKKNYGAETAIYLREKEGREIPRVFAATVDQLLPPADFFGRLLHSGEITVKTETLGDRKMTVIFGPLRDFSGKIIGLVKISVDRSPTLSLLRHYARLAAAMGLIGLTASIFFVWFISVIFTRRIEAVVKGADEIASGRRDTRLPEKSGDELDVMSRAINRMLGSLEASQQRLREYAQNLELMVEQRTRSLKESEQTYRTLVENVPLIVYTIQPDGTALFLNRATEQMIGLTPEELNGPYEILTRHIHSEERNRILALREESLKGKQELHAEYRLVHQNGNLVYCFDHAVPVFNENREFYRMDGIIIDVTVQKDLQEKSLQAQELETLGRVSVRLAHELRNPLASIGGLVRRIVKSFPAGDDRVEKGQMILEQIQKLEKILNMMLAFIAPQVVNLLPGNLNQVVLQAVEEMQKKFQAMGLSVKSNLDQDLRPIPLDEGLLEKVLADLMENAWQRMGEKGEMEMTTGKKGEMAVVTLVYPVSHISPDDLEHYFYPFTLDYGPAKIAPVSERVDVSIPKVVIHKHGGKITVTQEDDRRIKITIALPLR